MALGEVELAQVVSNLLDNASLHGQPPIKVGVDRVDNGSGGVVARIEVEGSGPGMDPQLLATATRRFTRSAKSRSRPGFGLGLALVAAAVSRNSGELRLCHQGHHQSYGTPSAVACEHGPKLTAAVLLPTGSPARMNQNALDNSSSATVAKGIAT